MLSKVDPGTVLPLNCVLVRTGHCSVRPQGDQYLIYNTKTDELHLISALGAYLVNLCDGLNSIGDLSQMFADEAVDQDQVHAQLSDFFRELLDRGVLEACPI